MKTIATLATAALVGLVFGGGCSDAPQGKPADAKSTTNQTGAKAHDHAEHAHPSTGPHDGHLIELGQEEFHAELVHDEDAGTVTIYLLDHDAKDAVAIDAKEVRINLKHDGKGEQFNLAASPQNGDAAGKASRFLSKEKELSEDLDHEGTEARLVVEIDGKSFTGEINHDHDHGEHKHKD